METHSPDRIINPDGSITVVNLYPWKLAMVCSTIPTPNINH